jgi:hypothetical protein
MGRLDVELGVDESPFAIKPPWLPFAKNALVSCYAIQFLKNIISSVFFFVGLHSSS